ncbi:arabinan endo-1,5-alpha-L-arabinosidase [soil metagenome]
MKNILFALLLFASGNGFAQTKPTVNDTLISVHDPVIIRQDSTYYIFCTGQGITAFSSPDMKHWKQLKPVFDKAPQWAVDAIPSFRGHIWAPDISYHNGQFYLYYAVSAFGKNTSCIGLATNKTLDPSSKNFKWVDHGKVIQSVPGRDMWNAIDPNLIMDEDSTPWLVFGSFWNGMKLVKLDSALTAVAQPEEWYTVASRKRDFILPDSVAGDAAIEAPFIYRHGKYFYLFVSFDYCCRGEKSTYKMMVGRSEKVMGPYADRDGVPMNLGGGSTVLEGDTNWHGVGHNAVANFNGTDYLIFHGYDAADNGRSKLRIEKIGWFNDWPSVERRR